MGPKTESPRAETVIVNLVTWIVIGVVSTALFALLGGTLRVEMLFLAAGHGALIGLLSLRRGGVLGDYVRGLREKPTDL